MRSQVIPLYQAHVPTGMGQELESLLTTGQIAGGVQVDAFQKRLGDFLGNPRTLLTGDVSNSISLALRLAGVGPGDEVALSPLVCLATSCPVANQFARVRWCDVDPETGNLDPSSLRQRITPQTKAVIVYHWAGNPTDMAPIQAIARERGIAVIEDAGEALGAEYGGRKIGSTGSDYTVFSFYPNRHITTIEGGAISFGMEDAWERGKWLRRYGIHMPSFRGPDGEINPGSDIPEAGLSTTMNQVSALMGLRQMDFLPGILERHQANGKYFDMRLASMKGVRPIALPEGSLSARWVYTFLAEDRDRLMAKLKTFGIHASRVHLRNDLYSCFGGSGTSLPGVDSFSAHAISIPCGWWVGEDDAAYIADCIGEILDG